MFDEVRNRFFRAVLDAIKIKDEAPVKCPCCGHGDKVHRYRIDPKMAKSLGLMFRFNGYSPFHALDSMSRHNCFSENFPKLKFWGLIEPVEITRKDSNNYGWWQITAKGESFVKNCEKTIEYYYVFDDQIVGEEGQMMAFKDCLF